MKTENRHINLFAARLWNPLFWLLVVFAPVVGIVGGAISGGFLGLLIGYEKGLDLSSRKLHKYISR